MSDEKKMLRFSIIVIVKPRYLDAVRENAHFQNRQVYISYTTWLKMGVDKAMRKIARFYLSPCKSDINLSLTSYLEFGFISASVV